MKQSILLGAWLMMGAGNAMAAIAIDHCPDGAGEAVDVADVLQNKRISDGTSNEVHCSGSRLVEIAEGVNDLVDPTHVVGTWDANVSNVIYNYSGGESFEFTVHKNGANYNFCRNGSVEIVTTLPDGSSSCAGAVN